MDRTELTTDLVLEVFRLNGALLAAGDALVRDIGLTSARWQVLGAIAMSPTPLSVAQTARSMGLSRQAVQRTANELRAEKLVTFEPNPHHARAKLLMLTQQGARIYAAALERQRPWARSLAGKLAPEDIRSAARVLMAFRHRLGEMATPQTGD